MLIIGIEIAIGVDQGEGTPIPPPSPFSTTEWQLLLDYDWNDEFDTWS